MSEEGKVKRQETRARSQDKKVEVAGAVAVSVELKKHPQLFSGNMIRAFSGAYVDVFDPKPEMFLIEDIAEGLAYKYRWGGHSASKITVAEHCVKVAICCAPNNKLAGLLHDASEAYLSDIPSPIKKHLHEYKVIENRVMKCIAEKFGFEWPMSTYIKAADNDQLHREWHEVVLETGETLSPEHAKVLFMDWFLELVEVKQRGLTPTQAVVNMDTVEVAASDPNWNPNKLMYPLKELASKV